MTRSYESVLNVQIGSALEVPKIMRTGGEFRNSKLLTSIFPIMLASTICMTNFAMANDVFFVATGNTNWRIYPSGGFSPSDERSSATRAIYNQAGTAQSFLFGSSVTPIGQLVFRDAYTGSGFISSTVNPTLTEATLTIFGINGLGIDNQVNQQITLGNKLTLAGNQEWRISSATGSIRQLSEATNANMNLDSSILTLNAVNAANFFQLDNPITGTGGIVTVGAGTVQLNGINSYTGGTAMNAGTVEVSADNNLGAANGVLSFNGGKLNTKSSFAMNRATTLNIGGGTIDTDAGTTMVQNGVLSGAGGLIKEGSGVLELMGINTYTGATTITSGELNLTGAGSVSQSSKVVVNSVFNITGITTAGTSIASLSGDNSGVVNVGSKTLTITNANDIYAGKIVGTGGLTLTNGWQTLNGDNSGFTGITNINGGTLSVNSVLGGLMEVQGGRLQGTGQTGDTTNYASGTIAPGNSIGTLLIAGNYIGNGGTLEIEGQFAGTGSPADRLLINGNASGTTTVKTINLGGAGASTGSGNTEGISIIQVSGTSSANTFQLAGGYAAAGPYQYQLRTFDPASSAASEVDPRLGVTPFYDYRLQSLVDASGKPVAVPQIAGYQVLPTGAVRYGASLLDSVHKRLGELRQLSDARSKSGGVQNNEFFMRAQGSGNDVSGNRASGYDQSIWYVQAGGNVFGKDMDDGATLRIGGAISFGESNLDADSTSARVNLQGTSAAVTTTYQAAGGWYLDGVIQLTKYSSDIKTSERGQTAAPDGLGYGMSLEGGYPFDLDNGLIIEPQAQLSYQKIKFDTFTDVDRIAVNLQDGDSLRGRVGGRIQQTFNKNTDRSWSPFVEANLIHEFFDESNINASGVDFASDSIGTSAQLGGGINAQVGVDKIIFASVNYEKGLSSAAADAWGTNIGMRMDF